MTATLDSMFAAPIAVATSNNTQWAEYDSQLDIPSVAGTRVVKYIGREHKQKDGSSKKAAVSGYVRIPTAHLTEDIIASNIDELTPYFLSYLQSIEDTILKDEYKSGVSNVYLPALGMDKILEKLEEQDAGARLNSEMITDWFDTHLKDKLGIIIATKLGIDSTTQDSEGKYQKMEMVLGIYCKKLCSLASPKTVLVEADKASLISLLESTDSNINAVGKRVYKRLQAMGAKQDDTLMDLGL